MRGLILPLLYIWCASGQREEVPNNFQVKLTSERGGPPPGAQFVPIPVVDSPAFSNPRPVSKRPKVGRPPPPPPMKPSSISITKPTRRPKPPSAGSYIAPKPPNKPVPVNQNIPQGSTGVGNVPALPPDVTLVTPMTEIRPDKETEVVPVTIPTTTPNPRDYLPADFYRLLLNEDGSYYFDFQAPNSVSRSEQGFFKRDANLENDIHVKTGTYSYVSPEGIPFKVNYIADERGFRTFTT